MLENNTILDDIRASMEQSLVLRAQLQSIIEKVIKLEAEGKQLCTDYSNKLQDLQKRETEVKEKEHKIFSAEDLEKQRQVVQEGFTAIENAKLQCDRECAEKRADVSNITAELAAKIKDLDDREKALEQEKKTYKETLLRKMGKEIK